MIYKLTGYLSVEPTGKGMMLDILRVTEDRFTGTYRSIAALLGGIGERPAAEYPSVAREHLARRLWFEQYLRTERLSTDDGELVEVRSPGWWNVEAGPDFRNAEIKFGEEEPIRGDVEVHLEAADWFRHGHHEDEAYDDVILHVVLREEKKPLPARTLSGHEPRRLTLSRFLLRDIQELMDEFALSGLPASSLGHGGPCYREIKDRGISSEWVGRFLDLAGDERMLAKAHRFAERLASSTLEEVLFEGMMESLGYKQNRRQFLRLARMARLSDLKRLVASDGDVEGNASRLQAILFGAAGMLPKEVSAKWDEATQAYVARLGEEWQSVSREFLGRQMEREEWCYAGVRPVNYPERRIAGMSYLLARHLHTGLFRAVLACFERAIGKGRERAAVRNLQELFRQEGEGYWADRCVLGGKRLPHTVQLLGKERAAAMALDVVIPLLLSHAREKKDDALECSLHAAYAALPPMPGNSITKYMEARIFGGYEKKREVVSTARRQQGLHQLYHDYCESQVTTCARCAFLAALQRSGEVTR